MKNEMFYGRSWQGVTLEKFKQHINSYMVPGYANKAVSWRTKSSGIQNKDAGAIWSNKMSAGPYRVCFNDLRHPYVKHTTKM